MGHFRRRHGRPAGTSRHDQAAEERSRAADEEMRGAAGDAPVKGTEFRLRLEFRLRRRRHNSISHHPASASTAASTAASTPTISGSSSPSRAEQSRATICRAARGLARPIITTAAAAAAPKRINHHCSSTSSQVPEAFLQNSHLRGLHTFLNYIFLNTGPQRSLILTCHDCKLFVHYIFSEYGPTAI